MAFFPSLFFSLSSLLACLLNDHQKAGIVKPQILDNLALKFYRCLHYGRRIMTEGLKDLFVRLKIPHDHQKLIIPLDFFGAFRFFFVFMLLDLFNRKKSELRRSQVGGFFMQFHSMMRLKKSLALKFPCLIFGFSC